MVTIEVSQDTEIFEFVELYLGDGLEMASNSVVTWGKDSTCSIFGFPGNQNSLTL